MDHNTTQIIYTLAVISILVLLLVFVLVNLLLTARNRKLRHRNQMQQVQSELREQVAQARYEVSQSILGDVSRDLHDEVGQLLTFGILQLENYAKQNEIDRDQTINEVKKSLRETMDVVRNIAKGINPDYVNQNGLVHSLEQILENVRVRAGINTRLMVSPDFKVYNSSHPVFIYRILRECITNSIRHSGANHINVALSSSNKSTEISYSDNGKGLPENNKNNQSLGMKNMKHYASLMHGELNIIQNNDKGSEILLIIPN